MSTNFHRLLVCGILIRHLAFKEGLVYIKSTVRLCWSGFIEEHGVDNKLLYLLVVRTWNNPYPYSSRKRTMTFRLQTVGTQRKDSNPWPRRADSGVVGALFPAFPGKQHHVLGSSSCLGKKLGIIIPWWSASFGQGGLNHTTTKPPPNHLTVKQ